MTRRWIPCLGTLLNWAPNRSQDRLFLRHLVYDAMIVIAGAVLAVILIDYRHRVSEQAVAVNNTRAAVRVLQAHVDLHAALSRKGQDSVSYPETIETLWFEEEIPTNQLLRGRRAWVEVASEEERSLRHPRNPTVEGGDHAMFWYNPTLGIVRARVPRTLSDAEAMALYNEVNGTRMSELTALSKVEDRD
jgi:hypothetical protein